MNRAQFLEKNKNFNQKLLKAEMPDVAEVLDQIATVLTDDTEATFSPEGGTKLDEFFTNVEKHKPHLLGNANQLLGMKGRELVKRTSELRKRMEQGDVEAAKEMRTLLKEKSAWRKQISTIN